MTTALKTTPSLAVRRNELLAALKRISRVVPKHSAKPILQGVRLEAREGQLHLAATDMEVSVITVVEAEGVLPLCVVPCQDLIKRLNASKAEDCSIRLDDQGDRLMLNGGRVDHSIPTLDKADFPVIPKQPEEVQITVDAQELRSALTTALVGIARDSSRYAINGMMLECNDKRAHLIATDGRRMVIVELSSQTGQYQGECILPSRLASLITKLVARNGEGSVTISIQERPDDDGQQEPAELSVSGTDWTVSSLECEGTFPHYQDVLPRTASRFAVDRLALLETLDEVATATNEEARGVRVDLGPRSLRLSAQAPGQGESSGSIQAEFKGGGDHRIITGFNPNFLRDALKSISEDQVIIDVGQNKLNKTSNTVCSVPALIYSASSQAIRWVVMPISTGLALSPETLGSNYEGDQPAPVSSNTAGDSPVAKVDDSAPATPSRQRRKTEHVWPDLGSMLEANYRDQAYTALVIAAPKLKSGRALQVIDGPAIGQTFRSMSAAMEAATAKQRRRLGLGKGKKGLPTSGWDFWKQALPERKSA